MDCFNPAIFLVQLKFRIEANQFCDNQNNKNIYLEEAENYLKYLFKINASQEEIDHAKNSIKKEKMLEDQE